MTETETVVAAGTVDQGGDLEIWVGWIGWSSVELRGIALKGALLKKWQNIGKFHEIYWKYHESMNIVDGFLLVRRGVCFVYYFCIFLLYWMKADVEVPYDESQCSFIVSSYCWIYLTDEVTF